MMCNYRLVWTYVLLSFWVATLRENVSAAFVNVFHQHRHIKKRPTVIVNDLNFAENIQECRFEFCYYD